MGKKDEQYNLEDELLRGVQGLKNNQEYSLDSIETDSSEVKPKNNPEVKSISRSESKEKDAVNNFVYFAPRIKLTVEQYKRLKVKAALENISMKEIIEKVAVNYINNIKISI